MVKSNALVLEAKAAAWLFTVSSNSAVHRVVLHALSNIPLQMVSIIRNIIGQQVLKEAVSSALASADYSQPEQRAAYERLIRSHIRLCPKVPIQVLPLAWTQTDLSPFVLTLGRPERAVQLLRQEMLRDSVKLDVAAWAKIMQKAMSVGDTGFEWIDGSLECSSTWRKFLSWFLCHHRCLSCARRRGSGDEVYALPFLSPHLDHFCGSHFSLVLDSKSKQESATTEPIFFSHAVQHFMIPSLSVVLYNFAYSSLCTDEVYDAVPSDIRLRLAMLQSTFIQSTSSESNERSLFAHALRCVHESLGVKGVDAAYLYHRDVLHATFLSLKSIADITFRSSGVLCARDRTGVLHALFRILILSPAHHEDYVLWMTDDVASCITRIIFTGDPEWHGFGRFIADALEANVQVPCTQLLSNLYFGLCTRDWLKTIAHEWFDNGLYYHYVKRTHTSYRFAAAAFIAGIDAIAGPVHDQVLEYIQQRENLVTLCKLLILADVEQRKTLRTLAAHIPGHLWMLCLIDMQEFLQSEETKGFYRYQLEDPHRHPYSESQTLVYEPFHKLPADLLKLTPMSHKPSHLVRIGATVPSPEAPVRHERNNKRIKLLNATDQYDIGAYRGV
ncbi:hypothetical protein CPB85DRAFT_1459265 [Mucidula mucida]|nr:hypothetical protein CPB85DRAFT_1459265 [Mucidula mucida]